MIRQTKRCSLLLLAFIVWRLAAPGACAAQSLTIGVTRAPSRQKATAPGFVFPAAGEAYVDAARKTGVPLDLLAAVAGAESGWHPWALNIRGQEHYCRSLAEAATRLAKVADADIGLMQVNFAFWGARLGYSKEQLLDPATNLIAGARILKIAMDRKGDFWSRAGAYHSLDSREQIKWNKAVYAHYREYLRGIISSQSIHE